MMTKATTIAATLCAAPVGIGSPTAPSIMSIRAARAGSPIQPRAREASVMPSWVAEM